MDLSGDIIESLFARSFDVANPNDPDRVDADRLASLEQSWREFMNFQTLALSESQLTDTSIDKPKEGQNQNQNQNRPAGGFPPGIPN
jgi:hypothetical protein